MSRGRSFLAVAALVAALSSVAAHRPAADDLHLALQKSQPAADATVEAPREIRLWFTQAPQRGVSTLVLRAASGATPALGKAAADPADAKVLFAPVEGTLAPGRYTVEWRTMAADGHVVNGSFGFTVRAQ